MMQWPNDPWSWPLTYKQHCKLCMICGSQGCNLGLEMISMFFCLSLGEIWEGLVSDWKLEVSVSDVKVSFYKLKFSVYRIARNFGHWVWILTNFTHFTHFKFVKICSFFHDTSNHNKFLICTALKVGFHYPSSRPEFTGQVDGPRTRVHFLTPVNSGRELG